MSLFNQAAFQEAVNRDGEFKIAGRFLDGAMKLYFAEESLLLKFRDGRLVAMGPSNKFDTADVTIKGPLASWREFLQPVPRPFFHDMFAAIVRNAFEWSGNSETFFAYYGAFRRLFQIMRDNATLR
jgi:hypothetical protein